MMDKILKLGDSKEKVPTHFQTFIERVFKARKNSNESELLPIETELIFAASIIISIEEGFRLDDKITTNSFDIRAFASLPSCLPLKHIIVKEKNTISFLDLNNLTGRLRRPISIIAANCFRGSAFRIKDFLGIPSEIKMLILKMLKVSDFIALSSTCKELREFQNNSQLWKYYLKRDFKAEPEGNMEAKFSYQTRAKLKLCSSISHYPRFEEVYTSSDASFEHYLS